MPLSGRSSRFTPPEAGAATPVRFPPIARGELSNGLRVWTIRHDVAPVVNVALVLTKGTADDPPDRHGLAGLTADLLDEGAAGRNAIQIAEAMSRLGTHLDVGIGADLMSIGFTSIARVFPAALELAASVVKQPHLSDDDFKRIRELRLSRLRQLRQSAAALGERTFLNAVFGSHGYGHGALGTTGSLETITLDEVRAWYERSVCPSLATLIVSGDVTHAEVMSVAARVLSSWTGRHAAARSADARDGRLPDSERAASRILLVDRPGAPQAELRIGHLGPSRRTPAYHALVTMNAALGGQFSSRINRHLREAKGWTYGARTLLDFRRDSGTFACETSVQADAAGLAVADVLNEFRAIRGPRPISAEELDRAKRSLTRGYVRLFETASNLTNAATQLATFDLPDDTFDCFVPGVESVGEADVLEAAAAFVHPERCVAVVVGDAAGFRGRFVDLGLPIEDVSPEM